MKLIYDTNVVLDVILRREPFYSYSAQAMNLCEGGDIQGVISAASLTDIFYIVKRLTGSRATAYKALDLIKEVFEIASLSGEAAEKAIEEKKADFEDDMIAKVAEENGCDYILTRDKTGFSDCAIKTITPKKLMGMLP